MSEEHHDESTDALSVEDLARIDRICVEFERAWKEGRDERVEDRLLGVAGAVRERLLQELLALELYHRRRRGESPSREALCRRFGDDAEAVVAVLEAEGSERAAGERTTQAIGQADSESRRVTPRDAEVPMPILPERIGRYRVEKILGEGSFGRVYRAHDGMLDRDVAVKVPHLSRTSEAGEIERFLSEARLAAQLDHPHIVPVFDSGYTADGSCFAVTKLVEGTDLRQKIKERSLSHAESAELVATLAEALHYAHTLGLVHRDIKPSNILIDASGRPKVADFGLAVHEEEQRSRRAEVSGSPAYMSPEQVRGEAHFLDGRADIWALGVMLYELLSGRRPFVGDTHTELFEEIEHREPKPLRMIDDAVPPELERITLKCLAKRLTERYATAADLATDLRDWLDGAVGSRDLDSVSATGRRKTKSPVTGRRHFRLSVSILGCGATLTITTCLLVAASFLTLPILFSPDAGMEDLEGSAPGGPDGPPLPEPSPEGPELAPHPSSQGELPIVESADLFVRRHRDDEKVRRHSLVREGREEEGIAVRPGLGPMDDFRFVARFDRPTYWYLLWFDSAGNFTVAGWSEAPENLVEYPAGGKMVSLSETDPKGWQLLMLVAGSLAPADAKPLLERKLADLGPPPQQAGSAFSQLRAPGVVSATNDTCTSEYLIAIEERLPAELVSRQLLFLPTE